MFSEPMLMRFATPSPLTLLVTRAQAAPTPIFCPPSPCINQDQDQDQDQDQNPEPRTQNPEPRTQNPEPRTQDRAPCPCIRLRWIEASACIYLWGGVALTCPGVSGA